ncbi:MAG: SRPBCC family protein [Pseudomonadota bacterium]
MKFSATQDVQVPIDRVFQRFSDFHVFEQAAIRRGAEVRRLDRLALPGPGMMWSAAFHLRGKRREVEMEMVSFDPPYEMVMESNSPGMLGTTTLEFFALPPQGTRLRVQLEIRPINLSGRLLIQSLKLAKGSLSTKFKERVAHYCTSILAQEGVADAGLPTEGMPRFDDDLRHRKRRG